MSDWISVYDQLPPDRARVLCSYIHTNSGYVVRDVMLMFYRGDGKFQDYGWWIFFTEYRATTELPEPWQGGNVTHWMLIPDVPPAP
jgi:Protein of unknown function (DUF551)